MKRSVRPKSAKGKLRPTPPNHSRSSVGAFTASTPSSSSSTSNANQYSNGRLTQRQEIQTNAIFPKEETEPLPDRDPSSFPEVSRPISSLSRYNILPRIPSTPGEGEARTLSPAGSEFELDLMSSFAQQMILDSTRMNRSYNKESKKEHKRSGNELKHPAPPKVPSSSATRRQNKFHTQDSPAHKRSRTTATRSVFTHPTQQLSTSQAPVNGKRNAEPKEDEPRLKLAIKLPDGKRVERYFSPSSTVNDVMIFAQTKMRIPIKQCEVYSMLQVPKVLIKSWKRTLEQLELRDRTMLYIEEKD